VRMGWEKAVKKYKKLFGLSGGVILIFLHLDFITGCVC
jgi:hypothetical protein